MFVHWSSAAQHSGACSESHLGVPTEVGRRILLCRLHTKLSALVFLALKAQSPALTAQYPVRRAEARLGASDRSWPPLQRSCPAKSAPCRPPSADDGHGERPLSSFKLFWCFDCSVLEVPLLRSPLPPAVITLGHPTQLVQQDSNILSRRDTRGMKRGTAAGHLVVERAFVRRLDFRDPMRPGDLRPRSAFEMSTILQGGAQFEKPTLQETPMGSRLPRIAIWHTLGSPAARQPYHSAFLWVSDHATQPGALKHSCG